jgi:hypothetical protein
MLHATALKADINKEHDSPGESSRTAGRRWGHLRSLFPYLQMRKVLRIQCRPEFWNPDPTRSLSDSFFFSCSAYIRCLDIGRLWLRNRPRRWDEISEPASEALLSSPSCPKQTQATAFAHGFDGQSQTEFRTNGEWLLIRCAGNEKGRKFKRAAPEVLLFGQQRGKCSSYCHRLIIRTLGPSCPPSSPQAAPGLIQRQAADRPRT